MQGIHRPRTEQCCKNPRARPSIQEAPISARGHVVIDKGGQVQADSAVVYNIDHHHLCRRRRERRQHVLAYLQRRHEVAPLENLRMVADLAELHDQIHERVKPLFVLGQLS